MNYQDMHESNRKAWNAATVQHNTHKGNQAAFLRDGGSTLFPEEIDLLGDIQDKKLLHLQCNSGQDTLSIAARLGANVTGVDISDEAIKFARSLSEDSGIPGTFYRADIYDWFAQNSDTFDVVFTSYGVIPWLSDLNRWADGIGTVLKPGGKFVMVEFHPLIAMYDDDLSLKYDYGGGRISYWEEGIGDYVAESGGALTHTDKKIENAPPFRNPHPSYEFDWSTGEIIMALLNAGLQITTLHEYLYSNGWKPFLNMRELPGRRMVLPEGMPSIPLMVGVTASRSP